MPYRREKGGWLGGWVTFELLEALLGDCGSARIEQERGPIGGGGVEGRAVVEELVFVWGREGG